MAKTPTPQKKDPKILYGEFRFKLLDNIIDKGGVTAYNNQIVNINQEIDERIMMSVKLIYVLSSFHMLF